uniref:DUF3615 domain-containing protein n=1 Tax=Leersia perrieri TaxID=77586 RepID=A0A0D9XYL2_9ORYZ
MEYLWFRQCDLTLELQQTVMTTKKNPYDAAVKASKQYTLLGKFLKSFSGKKLDSLRCMMESIHDDSPCVISNANWEKLNTMIKEQLCLVLGTRKTLHGPQDFVAIRDSAYASQQMFIRNKIEQLLDMYSRQHSWELRYKLDLVCGVEGLKSNYRRCYHANFLASAVLHPGDDRKTALPTPVRTRELFFAVFWESQPDRLNSKPICCPIQDCNASVGRCSFCGEESKIFHPPCAFGSRPNHGDAANTIPDYNLEVKWGGVSSCQHHRSREDRDRVGSGATDAVVVTAELVVAGKEREGKGRIQAAVADRGLEEKDESKGGNPSCPFAGRRAGAESGIGQLGLQPYP